MFLRKSRLEPLPVTMSAVRMGERVLQIGVDDPTVTSAIAAKVGLSGNAAIAVTDDRESARAHGAAANAGVLVDVKVTPLAPLPFDNDAFDLVIVHGMRDIRGSGRCCLTCYQHSRASRVRWAPFSPSTWCRGPCRTSW